MPVPLETLSKGHKFPLATLDLKPGWVAEYIEAVEDAAISALGAFVPPMAVAALSIRALLESAGLPDGALHLAQEIAFHRAVLIGERLVACAQIASRGERQGWVLMSVELAVENEAGDPVMSGRATVTFPTRPATGDLEAAAGRFDRAVGPTSPNARLVVKELTQDKIDRYADASGDHNPLHIDPTFATTRFGGTIAHGMLILAYLSELLTATFGQTWLSGGRLKVRFRAPARPGDTVTASGRMAQRGDSGTILDVECRNQHGELLVSGGAEVGP